MVASVLVAFSRNPVLILASAEVLFFSCGMLLASLSMRRNSERTNLACSPDAAMVASKRGAGVRGSGWDRKGREGKGPGKVQGRFRGKNRAEATRTRQRNASQRKEYTRQHTWSRQQAPAKLRSPNPGSQSHSYKIKLKSSRRTPPLSFAKAGHGRASHLDRPLQSKPRKAPEKEGRRGHRRPKV